MARKEINVTLTLTRSEALDLECILSAYQHYKGDARNRLAQAGVPASIIREIDQEMMTASHIDEKLTQARWAE